MSQICCVCLFYCTIYRLSRKHKEGGEQYHRGARWWVDWPTSVNRNEQQTWPTSVDKYKEQRYIPSIPDSWLVTNKEGNSKWKRYTASCMSRWYCGQTMTNWLVDWRVCPSVHQYAFFTQKKAASSWLATTRGARTGELRRVRHGIRAHCPSFLWKNATYIDSADDRMNPPTRTRWQSARRVVLLLFTQWVCSLHLSPLCEPVLSDAQPRMLTMQGCSRGPRRNKTGGCAQIFVIARKRWRKKAEDNKDA